VYLFIDVFHGFLRSGIFRGICNSNWNNHVTAAYIHLCVQ